MNTLAILISTSIAVPAGDPLPNFRLPDGFTIRQLAGPAQANDIYSMTVRPDGTVTVAGRGYIRLLKDSNQDGRLDQSIPFSDRPKNGAQGLCWHEGALYAVGDQGIYRFRVSDDGDTADGEPELLARLKTGGEHDAHAIRVGPDGWFYVLCGNMTRIGTDHAGEGSPITDPVAGCLIRYSPDFQTSQVIADGFRNPYDFDFHASTGQVFTYDSDNERCVGLPWFEPTRFYHVVPGGHHGWLSPQITTTWRMPPYFPDVVTPVVTLERGSPTGVVCYNATRFPKRYQGGFFAADWTFGRIWFVRVERDEDGSFQGERELFLQATGDNGFAPTDLEIDPLTGDLLISIGGRGTRGGVFRVSYDPAEPTRERLAETPPLTLEVKEPDFSDRLGRVRQIQRELGDIGDPKQKGRVWEGYTPRQPVPKEVLARLLPVLRKAFPTGDADLDRELNRTLAMLADDSPETLRAVVTKWTFDSDPIEDIHYLIVTGRLRAFREEPITQRIADALVRLDEKFTRLRINRDRNWPPRMRELMASLFRDPALALAILNHPEFGRPGHVLLVAQSKPIRQQAAQRFLERSRTDPEFLWDRDLLRILGELPTETIRPTLKVAWDQGGSEAVILELLARQPNPEDISKFRYGLEAVDPATVRAALNGLKRLPQPDGLDEVPSLILALRRFADPKAHMDLRETLVSRLEAFTEQDLGSDPTAWAQWLTEHHPELAKSLQEGSAVDLATWKARLSGLDWESGNVERGLAVARRANCLSCHGTNGRVGPDLSGVTKRFSRDDLFTAIVDPSRDIPDRYRAVEIVTDRGTLYRGFVIYEAVDGLILQVSADETVRLSAEEIDEKRPSKVSFMPSGLIDRASDQELVDLYAWMRSLQ